MTKQELLKKYYDMACHKLLCYSSSYFMDKPRAGYQKEWQEARVECELLEKMIKEAAVENGPVVTVHLVADNFIRNISSLADEIKKKVAALELAVHEQPEVVSEKIIKTLKDMELQNLLKKREEEKKK